MKEREMPNDVSFGIKAALPHYVTRRLYSLSSLRRLPFAARARASPDRARGRDVSADELNQAPATQFRAVEWE